jgi:dinuclear metal center YbgI/SA1388 family protein
MVELNELVRYTHALLEVDRFHDYCPNGLQIEGKQPVQKLVAGVTACQELLDAAISENADALIVHHGYFWKGENPAITGLKRNRVKCLLDADISLLAYHLPLDAHPEVGNNAQLAEVLGLQKLGTFAGSGSSPDSSYSSGIEMAMHGELIEPVDGEILAQRIQERLQRKPLHISGTRNPIKTIGWCSGAAQSYLEQAIALGLDAYITGEVSEQTVHIARESGIHFFSAGHHATERYGVNALGKHLAEKFSLDYQFVDIDNPV